MTNVVITGLGAVTSLGDTAKESWGKLTNGKSGGGKISRFDPDEKGLLTEVAYEINNFDFNEYPNIDEDIGRYIKFGLVSSEEAINDAGLDPDSWNSDRVGISFGSCNGGTTELYEESKRDYPSYRTGTNFMVNMVSGYVSIDKNISGPCSSPSTACVSGLNSVIDAYNMIKNDKADIVVAGASDSNIDPMGIAMLSQPRACTRRTEDHHQAVRPFGEDRDGTAIGEGSGAVIIESEEHAKERNADILAKIDGHGRSLDSHHPVRPPDEGRGVVKAMEKAVGSSNVDKSSIDFVFAHASGTTVGDCSEGEAISQFFNGDAPPSTSSKGGIGHTYGAAGMINVVFSLLSMRSNLIPPTVNCMKVGEDIPIPVVTDAEEKENIEQVLVNASGFGGINMSIVLNAK